MTKTLNKEFTGIKLRGHHLDNIFGHLCVGLTFSRKRISQNGYSKKQIENIKKVYSKMISKKKMRVKIVSGLDDICSACNKCESECYFEIESDLDYIKYYDFKKKIYTNKEVMNRLNKWYKKYVSRMN